MPGPAQHRRCRRRNLVAFGATAELVAARAYTWQLWGAAYLIGGGCSDDGFMDFRDGLILLGREAFEGAVADPDSLAGHPAVLHVATGEQGTIEFESITEIAAEAFEGSGET